MFFTPVIFVPDEILMIKFSAVSHGVEVSIEVTVCAAEKVKRNVLALRIKFRVSMQCQG